MLHNFVLFFGYFFHYNIKISCNKLHTGTGLSNKNTWHMYINIHFISTVTKMHPVLNTMTSESKKIFIFLLFLVLSLGRNSSQQLRRSKYYSFARVPMKLHSLPVFPFLGIDECASLTNVVTKTLILFCSVTLSNIRHPFVTLLDVWSAPFKLCTPIDPKRPESLQGTHKHKGSV